MIHVPPVNPVMGAKGTILFWGRNNGGESFVRPHTWLPPMAWETGNGTFARTSISTLLDYEAFCCGQTLLVDGKVAIAGSNFGSTGNGFTPGPQVAVYDPATNTWTKSPPQFELLRNRYYPSVTRMPSGTIVVTGGQASRDPSVSDEVRWGTDKQFEINPNTVNLLASWTLPNENDHWFVNYPFVFPVSETQLFFAGPTSRNVVTQGGIDPKYPTFLFSTLLSDSGPSLFGGYSETFYGSVVMYQPGKILKSGGVANLDSGHNYEHLPATNQAEKIDVGNLSSRTTWQFVSSMNTARIDHNMVVLPNGKVMALGGSTVHHEPDPPNQNSHRVISCEIWDPILNTWTYTASPADVFRGYHSTATLLPDGRVLLAGGDAGFPQEVDPPSGQVYLPNYGSGTRPEILTAPTEIAVGSDENVLTVDDPNVLKAVLIGLGAVTHSFDMNQRYVELELSTNIGTPTVKYLAGPTSNVQAPYGWYMLFVLKPTDGGANWLPCKMAKYVKIVPPIPD